MSRIAAFFDVDGTLIKKNAIQHYLYLGSQNLPLVNRWALVIKILFLLPFYFILDSIDRRLFNHFFYHNYSNYSLKYINNESKNYFHFNIKNSVFNQALACIEQHREQGHLLILVTGSLDFIVQPLADFLNFDAVLATKLEIKDEYYTGKIEGVSIVGEEKAKAMKNLAIQLDIDLNKSFGYGDSISDLAMLKIVGNSIVVNPNKQLKILAQQKSWQINNWN
ncbi:MAG: HAD family hydrolase [Mastigocoleus sp.]